MQINRKAIGNRICLSVAVSVLWQNGSVTTGWSNTDVANVALMILALADGKRKRDKRAQIKQRDWDRQKARLLRNKG